MRSVKAFLLGSLAVGLVAYALAVAAAVVAQTAAHPLEIAIGPVRLVSVAADGNAVVTTFGMGIVLAALAGGVVNLTAARILQRRAEREVDHVD
jgi:predicted regulator of Ras-like GTPase activity (Roadblock/LC7/MglB family)